MAHQAPAHSSLRMDCAVLGRALTPCITARLHDFAMGRDHNTLLSWRSVPAELHASMFLGQWTSFLGLWTSIQGLADRPLRGDHLELVWSAIRR